jgi:hypothetical protein
MPTEGIIDAAFCVYFVGDTSHKAGEEKARRKGLSVNHYYWKEEWLPFWNLSRSLIILSASNDLLVPPVVGEHARGSKITLSQHWLGAG